VNFRPRQFDLPVSLRDIAETLGLPIVLKLVEHYGGTEIKFPKHPGDDHPVLRVLGVDDGKALCSFLSGGFVYVPHGRARKSVRLDVLALQNAGKARREIARLLGVSQRHVRRMANRTAETSQLSLFAED
jgi:hypothetical protein